MSTAASPEPAAGDLSALQRAQAEFDASAGFDFPAAGEDLDGWLHRVEYSALALCGEAGELADVVKKARRARWLGHEVGGRLEQAGAELADVLAYVLKLSNLLDIDLLGAYVRKMAENRLRFAAPARAVTVMGPPGSGKSTVVRLIGRHVPVYVEEVERNPHLRLFEWESESQALASQLWFLESMGAALDAADRSRPFVVDQDPRAVVSVYGRVFRADALLSEDALDRLGAALEDVQRKLAEWEQGRRTVVLDADPGVLRERLLARGDAAGTDIGWLRRVRDSFTEVAAQIPDATMIRTDEMSAEDVAGAVQERLLAPV